MKSKILYITTDWNTPHRIKTGEYGGIGYYRAHGPAIALRARGYTVDVLGKELEEKIDANNVFESYKEFLSKYDLVVIKQADTSNVAKLIGACKEIKLPVVMDLDDLITELDPDNPATAKGYEEGGTKQAFAIASMTMCDALFVSTQPLADEYKKFLKIRYQMELPIFVLPNCCDPSLWTKQKKSADDTIVIGWQGSVTHDNDLKIALPAIKKIMKKNENVALSLTGGITTEAYEKLIEKPFGKELSKRVMILRGTPSYNSFPGYMSKHTWDIGMIPLRDSKFSRGKSHIKWLENSLLGVPSIVSDVMPYNEVVEDGKTGILCKDNEWQDKLEMLIADADKRKYIARDSRSLVMSNWKYSDHIYKWEEAFSSVIKMGSKSLST